MLCLLTIQRHAKPFNVNHGETVQVHTTYSSQRLTTKLGGKCPPCSVGSTVHIPYSHYGINDTNYILVLPYPHRDPTSDWLDNNQDFHHDNRRILRPSPRYVIGILSQYLYRCVNRPLSISQLLRQYRGEVSFQCGHFMNVGGKGFSSCS